jgi:hypothetical protein
MAGRKREAIDKQLNEVMGCGGVKPRELMQAPSLHQFSGFPV